MYARPITRGQRRTPIAGGRRSLYLPRVNGFGRLDWNSPDAPFGGQSAWTMGVMLSWSPFAGGSELAEIRSAAGRVDAARAGADAARAQAGLELAQATDALALALVRLEIADRSVVQAQEAHRIVSRKYDGGLATVSELFDAAAMETLVRPAAVGGAVRRADGGGGTAHGPGDGPLGADGLGE